MDVEHSTTSGAELTNYIQSTVDTLKITHGLVIAAAYQEYITGFKRLLEAVEQDIATAIIIAKTQAIFPQITLDIIHQVVSTPGLFISNVRR